MALLGVVALRPTAARADNIDVLVRDVKSGSDYKVRLSAVLALAKLADARGIPALVTALSDSDKTVRGAAAVALGKLASGSTPATTRAQIKKALDALVARESVASVKQLAQRTLKKLETLDAGNAGVSGTIYVEVDQMAAKVEPAAELKALMRKTAQGTLTKKAKDFMQTWPGGKSPTKKELTARRVAGFYLDGTVNELSVKQKGAAATVSCKISMLIATYPEKSIFGMLSGTASVAGTNDPRDIELAKQDCIAAVVEDLVNTKVVPTIRTKAAQ
ncbi:MAG: HEAT repeat domain-containing protein [Kofleriaceae bacterium]